MQQGTRRGRGKLYIVFVLIFTVFIIDHLLREDNADPDSSFVEGVDDGGVGDRLSDLGGDLDHDRTNEYIARRLKEEELVLLGDFIEDIFGRWLGSLFSTLEGAFDLLYALVISLLVALKTMFFNIQTLAWAIALVILDRIFGVLPWFAGKYLSQKCAYFIEVSVMGETKLAPPSSNPSRPFHSPLCEFFNLEGETFVAAIKSRHRLASAGQTWVENAALQAIAQADEDCGHQLLRHTHFENLGALEKFMLNESHMIEVFDTVAHFDHSFALAEARRVAREKGDDTEWKLDVIRALMQAVANMSALDPARAVLDVMARYAHLAAYLAGKANPKANAGKVDAERSLVLKRLPLCGTRLVAQDGTELGKIDCEVEDTLSFEEALPSYTPGRLSTLCYIIYCSIAIIPTGAYYIVMLMLMGFCNTLTSEGRRLNVFWFQALKTVIRCYVQHLFYGSSKTRDSTAPEDAVPEDATGEESPTYILRVPASSTTTGAADGEFNGYLIVQNNSNKSSNLTLPREDNPSGGGASATGGELNASGIETREEEEKSRQLLAEARAKLTDKLVEAYDSQLRAALSRDGGQNRNVRRSAARDRRKLAEKVQRRKQQQQRRRSRSRGLAATAESDITDGVGVGVTFESSAASLSSGLVDVADLKSKSKSAPRTKSAGHVKHSKVRAKGRKKMPPPIAGKRVKSSTTVKSSGGTSAASTVGLLRFFQQVFSRSTTSSDDTPSEHSQTSPPASLANEDCAEKKSSSFEERKGHRNNGKRKRRKTRKSQQPAARGAASSSSSPRGQSSETEGRTVPATNSISNRKPSKSKCSGSDIRRRTTKSRSKSPKEALPSKSAVSPSQTPTPTLPSKSAVSPSLTPAPTLPSKSSVSPSPTPTPTFPSKSAVSPSPTPTHISAKKVSSVFLPLRQSSKSHAPLSQSKPKTVAHSIQSHHSGVYSPGSEEVLHSPSTSSVSESCSKSKQASPPISTRGPISLPDESETARPTSPLAKDTTAGCKLAIDSKILTSTSSSTPKPAKKSVVRSPNSSKEISKEASTVESHHVNSKADRTKAAEVPKYKNEKVDGVVNRDSECQTRYSKSKSAHDRGSACASGDSTCGSISSIHGCKSVADNRHVGTRMPVLAAAAHTASRSSPRTSTPKSRRRSDSSCSTSSQSSNWDASSPSPSSSHGTKPKPAVCGPYDTGLHNQSGRKPRRPKQPRRHNKKPFGGGMHLHTPSHNSTSTSSSSSSSSSNSSSISSSSINSISSRSNSNINNSSSNVSSHVNISSNNINSSSNNSNSSSSSHVNQRTKKLDDASRRSSPPAAAAADEEDEWPALASSSSRYRSNPSFSSSSSHSASTSFSSSQSQAPIALSRASSSSSFSSRSQVPAATHNWPRESSRNKDAADVAEASSCKQQQQPQRPEPVDTRASPQSRSRGRCRSRSNSRSRSRSRRRSQSRRQHRPATAQGEGEGESRCSTLALLSGRRILLDSDDTYTHVPAADDDTRAPTPHLEDGLTFELHTSTSAAPSSSSMPAVVKSSASSSVSSACSTHTSGLDCDDVQTSAVTMKHTTNGASERVMKAVLPSNGFIPEVRSYGGTGSGNMQEDPLPLGGDMKAFVEVRPKRMFSSNHQAAVSESEAKQNASPTSSSTSSSTSSDGTSLEEDQHLYEEKSTYLDGTPEASDDLSPTTFDDIDGTKTSNGSRSTNSSSSVRDTQRMSRGVGSAPAAGHVDATDEHTCSSTATGRRVDTSAKRGNGVTERSLAPPQSALSAAALDFIPSQQIADSGCRLSVARVFMGSALSNAAPDDALQQTETTQSSASSSMPVPAASVTSFAPPGLPARAHIPQLHHHHQQQTTLSPVPMASIQSAGALPQEHQHQERQDPEPCSPSMPMVPCSPSVPMALVESIVAAVHTQQHQASLALAPTSSALSQQQQQQQTYPPSSIPTAPIQGFFVPWPIPCPTGATTVAELQAQPVSMAAIPQVPTAHTSQYAYIPAHQVTVANQSLVYSSGDIAPSGISQWQTQPTPSGVNFHVMTPSNSAVYPTSTSANNVVFLPSNVSGMYLATVNQYGIDLTTAAAVGHHEPAPKSDRTANLFKDASANSYLTQAYTAISHSSYSSSHMMRTTDAPNPTSSASFSLPCYSNTVVGNPYHPQPVPCVQSQMQTQSLPIAHQHPPAPLAPAAATVAAVTCDSASKSMLSPMTSPMAASQCHEVPTTHPHLQMPAAATHQYPPQTAHHFHHATPTVPATSATAAASAAQCLRKAAAASSLVAFERLSPAEKISLIESMSRSHHVVTPTAAPEATGTAAATAAPAAVPRGIGASHYPPPPAVGVPVGVVDGVPVTSPFSPHIIYCAPNS